MSFKNLAQARVGGGRGKSNIQKKKTIPLQVLTNNGWDRGFKIWFDFQPVFSISMCLEPHPEKKKGKIDVVALEKLYSGGRNGTKIKKSSKEVHPSLH